MSDVYKCSLFPRPIPSKNESGGGGGMEQGRGLVQYAPEVS